MKYLLDTSVFLWLRNEPERIRAAARARLTHAEAELALSAASGWEIAFKQALGRLVLPGAARSWLPRALDEMRCEAIPLDLDHAIEAALLPMHHRDPFDRLIVAQARVEGMTLVTSDRALAGYDVKILRA